MRESLAQDHQSDVLSALCAEVQASLALSRATLQALSALSEVAGAAAEAALEQETARAQKNAAPQRMLDIVSETLAAVQNAPADARMARALQHLLIDAADALPPAADRRVA